MFSHLIRLHLSLNIHIGFQTDLEIAPTYLRGFLTKDARHWRIREKSQERRQNETTAAVLNSDLSQQDNNRFSLTGSTLFSVNAY